MGILNERWRTKKFNNLEQQIQNTMDRFDSDIRKSTIEEEKDLISTLSKHCLEKLRENSYKRHWRKVSNQKLLVLLKEEIEELEDAINKKYTSEEIWKEASDIANFVAMIADNYKKQIGGKNEG